MRRLVRKLVIATLVLVGLLLIGGGLFAVEVLSRKRPTAIRSTTHASLRRNDCLDCHAPIAAEWRQSYHFRSLTGPYWKDVRQLGYLDLFTSVRKECVSCHAPANVLDLAVAKSSASESLGVECTPNLLEEPKGTIPVARLDAVAMGVDCTSCHVAANGIHGSGRRQTTAHETIADARFQAAPATAESLCRTCHRATVEAWKKTSLAAGGVTCLECHMPMVTAPSVLGGPPRVRRSHRFMADKDRAMLIASVNASLEIAPDRQARLRITNDRVGHHLPSGGNWLSVHFKAYDALGRMLTEQKDAIGRDETLILDFWPFNKDNRIAHGERREIRFPLPDGHGSVEAVIRYHDWMKMRQTLVTLKKTY